MSDQSNNQIIEARKHLPTGAYPFVFLVVTAVLGIYLGVILYSSPGKIKKEDKYKTEKTYEKKSKK